MDAENTATRPLRPPLAWEDGTPSALFCPACRRESACPKVLSVMNLRSPSETLALHACPECHSHFYHPVPNTNYTESYPELVARYHLLLGCSIEFALGALSAIPKRTGRLLDVGCGPGLIVDFWERLELGKATGIEPSPVGGFAIRALHRDVRTLHLDEDTELPDHAFDIVLSTEVLEHVSDPASFLRAMSKKVAPDGVLVFSTPNVGRLGACFPALNNLMEALSPGFHVTLFSEPALRQLLAELKWPHVYLVDRDNHWVVYASRKPLDPAEDVAWVEPRHQKYLELASRDQSLSQQDRAIFAYRLLKKAANEGNWKLVDASLPDIAGLLPSGTEAWTRPGGAPPVDPVSDAVLGQWLQGYFHLPALFFILGMRARNHLRETSCAIAFFKLAARLSQMAVINMDDAYTKEIYWVAQLNAGAALLESGDEAAGMEILENISCSMDSAEKRGNRLLPQLKFATRARLEMFKHQVQQGQWQAASVALPALQGYLSAQYPPSLLRISGWSAEGIQWPDEWNPFWYFYCEQMLLLNLGRNAEAAQGFTELHLLCERVSFLPDARNFLPLCEQYAGLARGRLAAAAKGAGFFGWLRGVVKRRIKDKTEEGASGRR